jgi:uncharacterized membrane protein
MKILTVLIVGCGLLISPASAVGLGDTVDLVVEPTSVDVVLGQDLDLTISVTNVGSDPTPPLLVHIDITDPEKASSVDPEDWTATLSKPIGALESGATRTVDWRIQPISGGTFALYAVALSPGVDAVAASNVVTVDVADQRSLDPNGILPVAIAAPAVVGALLVVQTQRTRRRSRASA